MRAVQRECGVCVCVCAASNAIRRRRWHPQRAPEAKKHIGDSRGIAADLRSRGDGRLWSGAMSPRRGVRVESRWENRGDLLGVTQWMQPLEKCLRQMCVRCLNPCSVIVGSVRSSGHVDMTVECLRAATGRLGRCCKTVSALVTVCMILSHLDNHRKSCSRYASWAPLGPGRQHTRRMNKAHLGALGASSSASSCHILTSLSFEFERVAASLPYSWHTYNYTHILYGVVEISESASCFEYARLCRPRGQLLGGWAFLVFDRPAGVGGVIRYRLAG